MKTKYILRNCLIAAALLGLSACNVEKVDDSENQTKPAAKTEVAEVEKAAMDGASGSGPELSPFPPPAAPDAVVPVPEEEIRASLRPEQWELLWSDEFNYEGRPDPSIWDFETGFLGYNDEKQHYTDRLENAKVTGGRLIITALREDYEGAEYTSARMVTKGKKEFAQARVEVRARFTDGLGTWPAIWLLGRNDHTWPACGEIDIMEHVGAQPNGVHGSFHTATYNHTTKKHATDWVRVPSVLEPHVYACEWDDKTLRIFIDDIEYLEVKRGKRPDGDWPMTKDHPYFVILNIAVGGFWGGMKGIDDSCFPQTMEVDYVRVFTRK